MQLPLIDNTWTLFIDRDGVINNEKKEDYILNWEEFKFYNNVGEAMQILSGIFGIIVMVTNQRGVGKQLMSEGDLHNIHNNMLQAITAAGGRIDKIYNCTSLDNNHGERKPNPGMAHRAKQDFKQIDFTKSLMVGNKLSDMGFGRNAGIGTVYVDTTNPETPQPHPIIDFRFPDLYSFALAAQSVVMKP